MTNLTLDALEATFPDVVASLNDDFDSHAFILKLAQAHQRLYVQALAHYADTDRPFQIVHGEIARRLLKHPDLVTKIGDQDSCDIFGRKNRAAAWRKVL